ncbi:MAG: cytochrome c peroxidase [Thermoanaerobaculia bacterium]
MSLRSFFAASFALLSILLIVSCDRIEESDTALASSSRSVFGTIPQAEPGAEHDSAALVALGRKLYFDSRLSINGTQSCNSCHRLDEGLAGVDHLRTSLGAEGKPGARNAPTVLNAGFNFVQFWDGRAANLEEQAKGPMLNPVEMAMPDEATLVARVRQAPEYARSFREAYGPRNATITFDRIVGAIAAFERTLRTHDRFDDFQNGQLNALTAKEKAGLRLFMKEGCASCHRGPLVGGNIYQKIGMVHPYPTSDQGRYEVTHRNLDRFVFKVPSLRNVALTAPYFHDGAIPNLDTAVEKMAWHQLGKKLTAAQREEIVAFLGSLSDESRDTAKSKRGSLKSRNAHASDASARRGRDRSPGDHAS